MLTFSQRQIRDVVLAGAITGVFLFLVAFSSGFVVDDAYISFTYAKNLAEGNGLTFNGMWVEGFSNPLWTLIIVPFIWLGIDPLTAARLLSMVGVLAILFMVNRLSHRLFPGLSTLSITLILLLLATSGAILTWTAGGLETVLAAFLVTWIVYVETDLTVQSPFPSALGVLALALTRPEGIMVFPIVAIYHFFREGYTFRRNLVWALLVAVPFGLFILWRLSTYGQLLPNTAYVKLDGDREALSRGISYVVGFFLVRPTLCALLVFAVLILVRQRRIFSAEWLLIGAIIAGFTAFAVVSGGDWMPSHRFLVPVLPLIVLVTGAALQSHHRWFKPILHTLAVSTLALELLYLVVFYRPIFEDAAYFGQGLTEAGKWIEANTDPDTVIAVVDAGMLSYYSERTTIDIIGLNNAYIAHNGSDPAYVLEHQPLLVQLHAGKNANGEWIDSHSKAGNDLVNHAPFHVDYTRADIVGSQPNWPILFVRRP